MAEKTSIAWCDHTTGFWQGCTKVSPGCDSCYAEARDKRFHGGKHWGPGAPRKERIAAACKDLAIWNRKVEHDGVRRRVFINSLADFFDNEVEQAWRDAAWSAFDAAKALDILLLTKRIGNVKAMRLYPWALKNVWLGITAVNQEEIERDLPKLLAIDAAKRFVSYEPALGEIEIASRVRMRPDVVGLDWIIVGGESGPKARPFPVSWARSVIEQTRGSLTACFVKQLGTNPLTSIQDGFAPEALAAAPKSYTWADPERWPTWLRVQEFPS